MKLVGRDHQLHLLGDPIAAVGERGAYMALVGEPGIGKSRLAEEASSVARAAGMRVVWGRCWEAGGAPALWPWLEVLRDLGVGAELAVSSDQFEAFDSIARALDDVARVTPLLVVLDDLHAADRSSLLLLVFVVRRLRRMRVVIIGTYRDIEARLHGDTAELLAKAAREGHVLALDRLDRADVVALARDCGREEAAEYVFATSEGNPLFAGELLRVLDSPAGAMPDGIRAVIDAHLGLVGDVTRAMLEVAAVFGRDFDARLVAEVAGESLDDVRARLEEARRAGLVVSGGVPDRFRFGHVFVRDALYANVKTPSVLHRGAADALARRDGDRTAIAHHWFAVGAAAAPQAIDAAVRAADEAIRRLAFDEAAVLFERACELASGRRQLELAIDRAAALIAAGRADDGVELCDKSVRAARELRAFDLLGRAALTRGRVFQFGRSDARLVAALEEAIAASSEGDVLGAQLLGRLAGALQPASDLAVPVATARRAIELARGAADRGALMSVLASAGSALQDVVDADERTAISSELVHLATAADDHQLAARGHLRLAFDHLERGDVAAADASFREHEALIVDLRNPRWHWPPALFRAMRADMAGRFTEADDHVAQAMRLADRAGDPGARMTFAGHQICTALVRGTPDELQRAERELEHAYHPIPHSMFAALLAVRLGRVDEARARVAAIDRAALASWSAQAAWGTLIGELVAAAGDREHCATVYDLIAPIADRGRIGVCSMTALTCLGPVARAASLVATALGRDNEAARHRDAALAIALRMRHEPVLTRLRDGVVMPIAVPDVPPQPPSAEATLRRDGDSWIVSWRDEHVRVRDGRGLQMIAELVTRAGDDVHVLDLSGGSGAVDRGDAGVELDRTALAQYRTRIAELRSDLDAAEDTNDLGRAEHLRGELEMLEHEIARAVGIGGRTRRAPGAAERARINVRNRIKTTIAQLEVLSKPLSEHFTRSIRTGSFCSYLPRR